MMASFEDVMNEETHYKTPLAHQRYDLLIRNRQRVKYDCPLHMQTKHR